MEDLVSSPVAILPCLRFLCEPFYGGQSCSSFADASKLVVPVLWHRAMPPSQVLRGRSAKAAERRVDHPSGGDAKNLWGRREWRRVI